MDFEKQLITLSGSYGDPKTPGQSEDANKINPLKHTIVGGLYIRELKRIKAPYNNITQPGTKRLIFIHEDTIWITVHATEKESVEEILEEIIAYDFDDPDLSIEAMQEQLKLKKE